MAALDFPLWLWTLLCIGGFGIAMIVHLGWHPLGRFYSDAFDLLKSRRCLLWIGAVSALSTRWMHSDDFHTLPERAPHEWLDWSRLARPLLGQSGVGYAALLHQINFTWPLALFLPFALILAFWNLWHHPYQCQLRRRFSPPEKRLWIAATLLSLAWLLAETLPTLHPEPEWLHTLRMVARLASQALLAAGYQVWAFRVAKLWLDPSENERKPDFSNAWWTLIGRWRQVFWLACFNATWMALRHWTALSTVPWVEVVLIETLLFFAPLPAAIAVFPPQMRFVEVGARALSALPSTALGLVGLAVTGTAIITLLHYAEGALSSVIAPLNHTRFAFDIINSFVLAFIHNWLFLASALLVLNRGFLALLPLSPSPAQSDPRS